MADAAEEEVHVLVPIANGSEEIETACVTDVLTRAKFKVTVASCEDALTVTMSRNLKITADKKLADCAGGTWAAIVCPGGLPGAQTLADNTTLQEMLRKQLSEERIVAAVCAAPALVLAKNGLLKKGDTHEAFKATCYPHPNKLFQNEITEETSAGAWQQEAVVVDRNVITSQGPGTSLQFALKIVEKLKGKELSKTLADALLTQEA
uniref:DJ-1/PfpI domain-containing protein n=1 Tax=Zooxanthella nutricula TaxID=1333877 RepID=A0A7S2MR37_9DINO|mmetsp:Transcript_105114/g.322238  ORF Transcript_105114/g.322238 Transcript_105114/m.322238 type:complete len:207 (+) Transcript_105114:78-698(+)